MNKYKYLVYCGSAVVGIFNYLKDALIYIQACDDEYYAETNWEYRIVRFDDSIKEVKNETVVS